MKRAVGKDERIKTKSVKIDDFLERWNMLMLILV